MSGVDLSHTITSFSFGDEIPVCPTLLCVSRNLSLPKRKLRASVSSGQGAEYPLANVAKDMTETRYCPNEVMSLPIAFQLLLTHHIQKKTPSLGRSIWSVPVLHQGHVTEHISDTFPVIAGRPSWNLRHTRSSSSDAHTHTRTHARPLVCLTRWCRPSTRTGGASAR